MNGIRRLAIAGAGGAGLIAAGAAATPSVLGGTEGGLWEVSRTAAQPVRLCVAKPSTLAQFEHRNASCSSNVVRESGSSATVHYTCRNGDFGHSTLTVVTPRSLRIETQGISGNAPFKYVLQARRVGNCPGH